MKAQLITALLLVSSLFATPSFSYQPGSPALRDDGWNAGSLEEAGFDLEKMVAPTKKRLNRHSIAPMVLEKPIGQYFFTGGAVLLV